MMRVSPWFVAAIGSALLCAALLAGCATKASTVHRNAPQRPIAPCVRASHGRCAGELALITRAAPPPDKWVCWLVNDRRGIAVPFNCPSEDGNRFLRDILKSEGER